MEMTPDNLEIVRGYHKEIRDLKAERDLFEAALQDIEASGTGCCQECGGEYAVLMQKIATNALHHK